MSDDKNICPKCGKSRVSTSMTQWLFGTKQCLCVEEEAARESDLSKLLCWTCGKPIQAQGEKGGTMTQWVFRSETCRCAAPNRKFQARGARGGNLQVVERTDRSIDAEDEPDLPGLETFAERYRILSLIGQGGDGSVFEARDCLLNKRVAIKRLNKARLSPEQVTRLQKEARAASRLNHPNLISVLDFGVAGNEPYLVMEYARGKTLRQVLAEKGHFKMDEAIDIAFQICDGLAHAHEKGVIHCDLNSGNIIICDGSDGSSLVKILDFGVARFSSNPDRVDDPGNPQTKTGQAGSFVGSPFYISPEQARGMEVDERADVYAIGCLLFEMLTGTPPYVGKTAAQTLMLHLEGNAPTLAEKSNSREFPQHLEELVARALSKEPADRFSSMVELCASLVTSFDALAEPKRQSQTLTIQKRLQPRTDWHQSKITISLVSFLLLIAFTGCLYAVYLHLTHPLTSKAPNQKKRVGDPAAMRAATWPLKTTAAGVQEKKPLPSEDEGLSAISPELFPDLRSRKQLTDEMLEQMISEPVAAKRAILSLRAYKGLTGERVRRLAKLPLNTAILSRTDITDDGIAAVSKCPDLLKLHLNGCEISDAGIDAIAANARNLIDLDLSDTHLSDEGLAKICRMNNLVILDLNANDRITSRGWQNLAYLKKLRVLELSFTNFSDNDAPLLKDLPKLESIGLKDDACFTDKGMEALVELKHLKNLKISNTKVSRAQLLKTLPKMHLISLLIDSNQLSSKDILMFPGVEISVNPVMPVDSPPELDGF